MHVCGMWGGAGGKHADAGKTCKQQAERSQAWETNPQPLTALATAPATILASQVLQPHFKWRYWNNHHSFSLIGSLESSLSHFAPPLSTTNTFFVIKGHFVHFFKCFVVFCNGQGWLWVTLCRQLTKQLLKVLPQRVGTDQPTHKPTDCLFTLLTFQVWNQWQSVSQPPDHASPLGSKTKVGDGKIIWNHSGHTKLPRSVAVHSVQFLKHMSQAVHTVPGLSVE